MHVGPALGGAGPNWIQFRFAQVPSQLAPRSVELGAGPTGSNWSNGLKAGPVLHEVVLWTTRTRPTKPSKKTNPSKTTKSAR